MLFVYVSPPTGQEANKGPVWCAGPSSELLQVHSTGVQRDVPSLLHQAAALQSHQVPSAVQINGGPPTSLFKTPVILHHSRSSNLNVYFPPNFPLYFLCLSHDAFPHLWPLTFSRCSFLYKVWPIWFFWKCSRRFLIYIVCICCFFKFDKIWVLFLSLAS